MMTLLLAAALAGEPRLLTLAAGQGNLYSAHWQGFPKVGWVVGEPLPVNASPQFAGPMSGVIQPGSAIEVGAIGSPLPRAGEPGVLDEVIVLSLGPGPLHRSGYAPARGVPVLETLLAHGAPGVVVFATVVGSRFVEGVDGMVLDLEIWVRQGEGLPRLVLAAPNHPPLETATFDGGIAVALGGQVAVLAADGSLVFRSPAGERWTVERAEGRQVHVQSAAGARHVVEVPSP